MKRFLASIALLALTACNAGGVVGGPSPEPSPSASPTPKATCGTANRIRHSIKHILRPRGAFAMPAHGNLKYNGGPILDRPVVYLVLWGFAATDPAAVELTHFYSSVGGTSWAGVMDQYCEAPNVYFSNPSGILGGVIEDYANAIPAQPSDTDIANEAVRMAQHFSADVNEATIIVATASGHSTPGFKTQYCGWHDATPYNGGQLSYEDMPYQADAGGGCGAQPNDKNAGESIVGGHELAESITDPVPPSGWSIPAGEIGDLCAWINIHQIMVGQYSLYMQGLWDNHANGCTF